MDPLFQYHPFGAIKFFKKVFIFGTISSSLVAIPVTYLIYESWEANQLSDRILHFYHMIRVGLYLIQTPARLISLYRLRSANQAPNRIEAAQRLKAIIESRAWRLNHMTGFLAYCLMSFAYMYSFSCSCMGAWKIWKAIESWWLIFTYHPLMGYESHCIHAPTAPLYQFLVLNLVLFIVHLVCTLVWVRQLVVGDDIVMTPQNVDQYTKIITIPEIITSPIPEITLKSEEKTAAPTPPSKPTFLLVDGVKLDELKCSICWDDYTTGEKVRVLPCAHHFHSNCSRDWLSKKPECPLCLAQIDVKGPKNQFMLDHTTPSPDEQEPLIVGAALTAEEPIREQTSSSTSATSSSTATSMNSSTPSTSGTTSSSSTSTELDDEIAATLDLIAGLNTRRPNQGASGTASRVYSTASSIQTMEEIESSTSPVAVEDSLLTRRGVPVKPSKKSSKSLLSSSSSNLTPITSPAAPVLNSSAIASSSTGSSTAATAVAAGLDRSPYVAARFALATQAWRSELDSWATDAEGDMSIVNEDEELVIVPEEKEKTDSSSSTTAPSSEPRSAPQPLLTSQPSQQQQLELDRLVEQWKREEEEQQRQSEEQE